MNDEVFWQLIDQARTATLEDPEGAGEGLFLRQPRGRSAPENDICTEIVFCELYKFLLAKWLARIWVPVGQGRLLHSHGNECQLIFVFVEERI
jgi:hypothetical protein